MNGQTDIRRTKWSLCATMLRRWHKKVLSPSRLDRYWWKKKKFFDFCTPPSVFINLLLSYISTYSVKFLIQIWETYLFNKYFHWLFQLHIHIRMAAFQGMHMLPVTHIAMWKCDYQTDTRTDRCRKKWYLCAAMLRRRHMNVPFSMNIFIHRSHSFHFIFNKFTFSTTVFIVVISKLTLFMISFTIFFKTPFWNCSSLFYHMFLGLWSEISLFHKLIYGIPLGSILIPSKHSTLKQRWINVELNLRRRRTLFQRWNNVALLTLYIQRRFNVVSTSYSHIFVYMSIYQKMIREHRKQTLTKHQ